MVRITDYIHEGSEVTINGGYLVIERHNGSGLYDCAEFEFAGYDRSVFTGMRRLTLKEIAKLMQEADGHRHVLEWLGETELPFC